MDKILQPLRVSTTNNNEIEISQDWDDPDGHQVITISPAQVDILINWLKEAKAELE